MLNFTTKMQLINFIIYLEIKLSDRGVKTSVIFYKSIVGVVIYANL